MKRLVLLLLLLFPAVAFSQTGKIKVAHFDRDSLLSIMPEAIKANDSIAAYQSLTDHQRVLMQEEYNRRQAEYRENKHTWSPLIIKLREKEMQITLENIEMYNQMVKSEIETIRASLFDPIKAKINAAAAKVAAKKGYAMVIDSSESMSVVPYADPAYDIFNDLCIELGIKK